ncbi:nucleotidyltransferase domain-containing protein [Microbacterium sp. MYb62]|uniref:nucleotidyltransferase domain-containing protein n=1 Tax=Microbacterium sp. MYb62 TaxID=1848690 RepID=UPI0011B0B328|nr:nucleotidyltransferase domain-containing protein [Microbacterium sp. MYb62]
MEHAAIAERFIAAVYPRAEIAVIAGSTARGERTATSDVDLLLIGDSLFDVAAQTSEAATHEFEGEIFEVFAYRPEGFAEWADRGIEQHRPVIVHMLVEGIPIRSTPSLESLREQWSGVLDAGPSLDAAESAFRRYMITDLLDDLRDATDALERRVVSATLFERIAELMLLAEGRWIAAGKWLPRRLRDLSPERAALLSTPLLADDLSAFAQQVEAELRRAGGRVQAGFVR